MSIEPSKKKKPVTSGDNTPFTLGSDFMAKPSGAPETTNKPDPHEPTPPGKTVTSPKEFNEILRRAFESESFRTGGRDFGSNSLFNELYHAEYKTAEGPMRSRQYEYKDGEVVKVSLEEALRREFEYCKLGNESIGFHVSRTLDYIRQYIDRKDKL